MFGDELKIKPGQAFSLGFDLASVAGLKRVDLIGAGSIAESREFSARTQTARVDFSLNSQHSTWYSLIVEDTSGNKAYSDPIWIDVVEWSGLAPPGLRPTEQ